MWTLDNAIQRRRLERALSDLQDYVSETQTQDSSIMKELKELREALKTIATWDKRLGGNTMQVASNALKLNHGQ